MSISNFIPYVKVTLYNIRGIIVNDIYSDNELNVINIPIISNPYTNVTNVIQNITARLRSTWLTKYIQNINYNGSCVVLKFKRKNESYERSIMSIKKLNEEIEKMLENIRLADEANELLDIGDFYLVDNKMELISGLDKLTLGDSIGLIQNDYEITITLEDEDMFGIVVDTGLIENDWEIKEPEYLNKEDLIKFIKNEV